jgi:putative SOS response-associated peptidase YedK
MCGRYAIVTTPEVMKAAFGYGEIPNFPPRYNIAPTQPVPVIHQSDGQRHFTLMRWGFIPGWVKDLQKYPLVINIRSETAREKASFRAAFQRRRALMPADGFYEWQRLGKLKRPFLIRRPDQKPFAFAALWETFSTSDGSELDTVAMMTTSANGLIAAIHDRAPVILHERDYDLWLDPGTSPGEAESLLRPPPDGLLEMVPVSDAVNKVANDDPAVQEPPPEIRSAASVAGGVKTGANRTTRQKQSEAPDQGNLF